MARTRDQLIDEISKLRKGFEDVFKAPYDGSLLQSQVRDLIADRYKKFVLSRIGHLPDVDLIAFWSLFIQDIGAPVVKEQLEVKSSAKANPKRK